LDAGNSVAIVACSKSANNNTARAPQCVTVAARDHHSTSRCDLSAIGNVEAYSTVTIRGAVTGQ